jgi:hypothetical protein
LKSTHSGTKFGSNRRIRVKLLSAIVLSAGCLLFAESASMDLISLPPENFMAAKSADSAVAVKTLNQALSWAENQRGQPLDIDSAFGAQCVDLTMAYSDYLFGSRTFGNAIDYTQHDYPGFTRLSKFQTKPQAGDIAVWTGGPEGYGHVGLVLSASGESFTTLEQNVNNNPTIQQYQRSSGMISDLTFWGVQRPALTAASQVPEITNSIYWFYKFETSAIFAAPTRMKL